MKLVTRYLMFVAFMISIPAVAQEKPAAAADQGAAKPADSQETADLAKSTQNPVASLISVPIQENWNFGIKPGDRIQNVMLIQPVIPVELSKNWNLIIRWISPVIFQPVAVPLPSGPAIQSGWEC